MSELTKQIADIILQAVPGAQVIVDDPMNDGAHFDVIVISESFIGMPIVKQHRQVMPPLKDLFAGDLHAVALKTFTPEQWANSQG
jgi:acid stress-induced BolA-like protein IbaG/YrbA